MKPGDLLRLKYDDVDYWFYLLKDYKYCYSSHGHIKTSLYPINRELQEMIVLTTDIFREEEKAHFWPLIYFLNILRIYLLWLKS